MSHRPKIPGVWILITFHDGTETEAMIDLNLLRQPVEGIECSVLNERYPDSYRYRVNLCYPRRLIRSAIALGSVGSQRLIQESRR